MAAIEEEALPETLFKSWVNVYDSVMWFKERMMFKLWKHREKRFWLNHPDFTMNDARLRMEEEIVELDEAIDKRDWNEVVDECADIANFCMMVAQMAYELDKSTKEPVQWSS